MMEIPFPVAFHCSFSDRSATTKVVSPTLDFGIRVILSRLQDEDPPQTDLSPSASKASPALNRNERIVAALGFTLHYRQIQTGADLAYGIRDWQMNYGLWKASSGANQREGHVWLKACLARNLWKQIRKQLAVKRYPHLKSYAAGAAEPFTHRPWLWLVATNPPAFTLLFTSKPWLWFSVIAPALTLLFTRRF